MLLSTSEIILFCFVSLILPYGTVWWFYCKSCNYVLCRVMETMSDSSIKGSQSITIEEEQVEDEKNSRCVKIVGKYIPIIKWLPKYTQMDAVSDLIAGITLGLTIIPQSIAYAALAGLTAQYGLYSAFGGSIIYIIFGTIKEVSIGPTSLMALLTIELTRNMPLDFVIFLGFISGCIEMVMGLLNLGFLVDFISIPVTSGFVSATSVIIIIGQLQGLLGLKFESKSTVDNVIKIFQHIGDIRIGDTVVGISSIIFLLILKQIGTMDSCCKKKGENNRTMKKFIWFLSLSRNALTILITSIIAAVMLNAGETPFFLSGKVASGLPSFSLPPFSSQVGNKTYTFIDMCSYYGFSIITTPIVAILANVSIAKAFASGKAVDASQEMRALGLCNIFGGFVQSMPTCGAFTRSAVSHASGVRTPLSGIYTGVMTLLALSFLTPYFSYIPRASLAAVLITAVMFMMEWSLFIILWKGSRKGMVAAVGTFIACVLSVEYGLLFGAMLNVCYLVHIWARPRIEVSECRTTDGDKYILITPDIGLYYPAIQFLRDKVEKAARKEGKDIMSVILDFESIKGIDYTSVKGIEVLVKDFEKKNQQLLFLHLQPKVLEKIEMLGGIKGLKHVQNEDDIAANLFGDSIELTRSATAPILKQVENVKDQVTISVNQKSKEDEKSDLKNNQQERESLLMDYKAVIKEFETVEKSCSES